MVIRKVGPGQGRLGSRECPLRMLRPEPQAEKPAGEQASWGHVPKGEGGVGEESPLGRGGARENGHMCRAAGAEPHSQEATWLSPHVSLRLSSGPVSWASLFPKALRQP